MKIKSSLILGEALKLVESGQQKYACAAIQDVETQIRWDNNVQNVVSKATDIFMKFKPSIIPDNMKLTQGWWPIGSEDRIIALKEAIKIAKQKND